MKLLTLALLAALTPLAASAQSSQTADQIKSAAPAAIPGETQEQHGRRLLDEMLKALGGQAWLDKKDVYLEGQTAPFFRGEPSGGVVRFVEFKRFATYPPAPGSSEVDRVEFVSYRGLIEPGTVRTVAHLWTADQGYEFTFKGRTTLPVPQVTDYLRRRAHSLEELMHTWINQPGAVILFDGQGMRDRRPIDKVTILAANNDSIGVELEQGTHLPMQRSFQWRNEQFKDFDLDEEVYGDWKIFNGIATPMNITRYRNGDMADQTFFKKVEFNQPMSDDLFNKDVPFKKK